MLIDINSLTPTIVAFTAAASVAYGSIVWIEDNISASFKKEASTFLLQRDKESNNNTILAKQIIHFLFGYKIFSVSQLSFSIILSLLFVSFERYRMSYESLSVHFFIMTSSVFSYIALIKYIINRKIGRYAILYLCIIAAMIFVIQQLYLSLYDLMFPISDGFLSFISAKNRGYLFDIAIPFILINLWLIVLSSVCVQALGTILDVEERPVRSAGTVFLAIFAGAYLLIGVFAESKGLHVLKDANAKDAQETSINEPRDKQENVPEPAE